MAALSFRSEKEASKMAPRAACGPSAKRSLDALVQEASINASAWPWSTPSTPRHSSRCSP
eukprot:scaffold61542_cov63-Phaeocystis_antarctica.AAC.3